jgi:carbamoyl-phosphate synthase large subunit
MDNTFTVLFLAAGKRLSLFERFQLACRQEGVDPRLASYETTVHVPVAQVSSVVPGKSWDDPALKEDIQQIVKRQQVKLVIPCVNRAAVLLGQWANELQNLGCTVVASDADICRTFDNKRLAEQWFVDHGVLTPRWTRESPWPWIIKPVFGAASRGQFLVHSSEEFDRLSASLNLEEYLIQPFVPGVEYTVDAYVSRSHETLGCVPRRRLQVVDGEVVRSVTERNEGLIQDCQRILNRGGFRGPITLQAIEQEGRFWFLEINPRFGGGVILSMQAGAEYARLCVREALGRPVEPVTWRAGVLMTRAYREIFFEGGEP